MNHNKEQYIQRIIADNINAKKRYPNFPKLPKIIKSNKQGKLVLVEINELHTQSVFRGYLKRITNFINALPIDNKKVIKRNLTKNIIN